jgi:ComEC/Rec2-related protein
LARRDLTSDFSIAITVTNLIDGSDGSTIRQKVFTPSFFIFLSISSSILLCCSYVTGEGISGAGILLLSLALISLPLVYFNALKADTGETNLFARSDALRILALLLSALLCSLLVCARIRSLTAEDPLKPGIAAFTARVESVTQKRYRLYAVILFRARGRGASSADNNSWHRGAAYITGGCVGSGDLIQFTGKPVPVKIYGGYSSSYSRSRFLQGIRHIFYLDARSITVKQTCPTLREKLRERLAARCDALFEPKTSSMVKALYFGNQDYIDKRTMHDFKRAGVLHILSASGHDVGVVAGLTIFMLGLVRINRKIIMAAAALAVFMYLYVTDMPVSLLRSCIMFFIYAVQRMCDRDVNIFNALFLSAAVIAVAYPHEIYGLGFQLSYGATLGILLFHATYRKTLSLLPAAFATSLALTTAAQVPVLPILLVRVGELNLAGLLSNIVVVPLMSLLLLASMAANASPIGIAAVCAARAADMIYYVNGIIVSFLSGLNCHFYVEETGPGLITAFCLLILPLVPRLRGLRIKSLSVLAAVAVAWISLNARSADDQRGITAIRHGHGMLLLVKNGSALRVIGDLPDARQLEFVRREIASAACRDVSLHILNPDYHNVTGYTYLVKQLAVRKCYLSGGFRVRKYMRRFFDILERDAVELILHDCRAGDLSQGPGNRGGPGECACGQYHRISAEGLTGPVGAVSKKNGIRYLTLH